MSESAPFPVQPHPLPSTVPPQVSVLIPVTRKTEALDRLYEEYSAPFRDEAMPFEFLFLVEPAAHGVVPMLLALAERGEPVRILEVGQNVTVSSLLQSGAFHAQADIVVTIPAAQRVVASALPRLVTAVQKGADVVVARRWPRQDSRFSQFQGRIFQRLIVRSGDTPFHDISSGVRALRRDVLMILPLHGDLHRFLPLFALRDGYRVVEVDAEQHSMDVRSGLFSPIVYLRRLVDILGLYFLLNFTEKPLRFFGMLGASVAGVGAVVLALTAVQRIGGQPLADRPLLVLGVMLVVLGVQSIALGLIGEIFVHLQAPTRRPYRLAEPPPTTAGDALPGQEDA